MDMPLAWLRAFEAAGRHLSFKDAASELNVSPSTISHQLRDLEAALGYPLFSRSGRSLRLTDEGERYLQPLVRGFSLIRSAPEAVNARPDSLRIGAFPFLINEWLAPNTEALKSTMDVSQLSFYSNTSRTALLATRTEQRLDAVIRYGQNPADFHGLDAILLGPIELVPICAMDIPIAETVDALLAQPRIRVISPFNAWQQWSDHLKCEHHPGNIVMETDSYHTATLAVERGEGTCLGIFPFLRNWVETGRVRALTQFSCPLDESVWVVSAPHNRNNSAIPRLAEWLTQHLYQDPG